MTIDIPEHGILVSPERKVGALTWYRAICACGARSALHGTKAHVQRWADEHKKNTQTREGIDGLVWR